MSTYSTKLPDLYAALTRCVEAHGALDPGLAVRSIHALQYADQRGDTRDARDAIDRKLHCWAMRVIEAEARRLKAADER